MEPTPIESPAIAYLGHVKNGVIVLDTDAPLTEGQAVRVEPLPPMSDTSIPDERAEQLQRMKTLFAQWNSEDQALSDEEAERLQHALQRNRGVTFRSAQIL